MERKFKEPVYDIKTIDLVDKNRLIEIPFLADFVAFVDVSEVNPDRVYVAFNAPIKYIPISKVLVARTPKPIIKLLYFNWEDDQEGKKITFYISGAPTTLSIATQIIAIGADYTGILKKSDLYIDANKYLGIRVMGDDVGLAKTIDVLPTKEVEHPVTSETIAGGGSIDVDLGPIANRTAILATVRATFDAGASEGVALYWLLSPDGSNYDDETSAEVEGNYVKVGYDTSDVFVGAGTTMQRSTVIPFLTPYIRLRVKNLDATHSVTVDLWRVLLK